MPNSPLTTSEYTDSLQARNLNAISHPADTIVSANYRNELLLVDSWGGTEPLCIPSVDENGKGQLYVNVYVLNGSFTFSINGVEDVVSPQKLITFMPGNSIKIIKESPDLAYFMICVHPRLANEMLQELSVTYFCAQLSSQYFIAELSPLHIQNYIPLYNDIKRDIIAPDYEQKYIYLRCLLNALTVENMNVHNHIPLPAQGKSYSHLYDIYSRFITLLNKRAKEEREVQYYAKKLGISSKYLSYVCICYSNKNASTWISEAVIQRAKNLMLIQKYSLEQVCTFLNFSTVSNFNRYFKRATGESPKEFLKKELHK